MAYYRIRQVCVAAIQFPWLDRQHRITAETWKVIICTSLSVYIVSTSLCLILFNQSHAIFWEFIGIQNPLLPKFSERSSKNLRFLKEKKFHTFHASMAPSLCRLQLLRKILSRFPVNRRSFLETWSMSPCRQAKVLFDTNVFGWRKSGLRHPSRSMSHVNMWFSMIRRYRKKKHAYMHASTHIQTYTHTHTRIRTYTCPCPSVYSSLMQFGNVKTYQAGLQNVKSTSQPVRT